MEAREFDNRPLYARIDEWLINYKKRSVKPASYDRLRSAFRLMYKYPIADIPLSELRAVDVQKFLNSLSDDGYSASTVKKEFTLLTAYFKYAISNGDLATPIYVGVKMPNESTIVHKRREIKAYSVPEQIALKKVLQKLDHPTYAVATLMLECGMRIGEVLALKWSDIDFTRKSIHIHRTVVRLSNSHGHTFVQDGAKSKTSNRVIPMSRYAMETLQTIAMQADDMSGFIFPQEDDPSSPITYATVKYYLKRVCKTAEVEYCGCHIFRHTFASNCYSKGADVKILSKLLGHADVAITFNTYIHLYGDALEEMRKVVD